MLLMSVLGLMVSAEAQTFKPSADVQLQARVDYQYDWLEGETLDGPSGFKGKYLNIYITGNLTDKIKYSYRQRLNKKNGDSSFFDATDWIYLTYAPNSKFDFSAGKQVVGIGGYEYDKAPINVMNASEFWNNIPCYELGASIGYTLPAGNDRLAVQVTENPFRKQCDNNNTYAYSLMWTSNHGWYQSLWSANMIEYRKNHYISYISLGNRFTYRNWMLDLDVMNRASAHQVYFLKDVSVIGDLSFNINRWKAFAKVTYDANKSGNDSDWTVYNGTEMWSYSAGAEFYPLKNDRHDLRLHAYYTFSHGKNGNIDGALRDNNNMVNVGLTWMFDVIKLQK